MTPKHPTLYAHGPDGLVLHYARCPLCARLSFPATVPGCARCGAPMEAAQQVTLAAQATLRESVLVHEPLVPPGSGPAAIGLVDIADGLTVEAPLAGADAITWPPGTALRGQPLPAPDGSAFSCVFGPMEAPRHG